MQQTQYTHMAHKTHIAQYEEGAHSMNELATVQSTSMAAAPSAITADLMQRYIAYLDAKPKTVQTYTRALRQFIRYMAENGITAPRREDIIAFRDGLKETHKPSTVQSYITAVRLFFAWTEQEGLYKNVAEHIKGAQLNKDHKKDYLTSTQIRTVLADVNRDTLQGKRDYAMLTLMTTGGLRTIEVARANIEDIRTVGDDTVLYIQGKGREERTEYVKVMPHVENAIRTYLRARGQAGASEPLFASLSRNNMGGRMTTRSISGIAKSAMVEAGYDSDRLTAHSLRHTAVTLSLLGGASLQEAQQFARHSNIATTTIYAHNLERAQNRCEEKIASAIF